jgi:AcrR family transcriptional regulator
MTAIRNARERARAELTREIKAEARRQLGASGAQGLSLRAVARELGMVSSALYRYFPSRDDLLTALIIDAYNALGDRVEAAGGTGHRERWRAYARTIREWARANPHEYALVYGSPVPGYQAPQATVVPASRVPLALLAILTDAWEAGALTAPGETLSVELDEQLRRLTEQVAIGLPEPVMARALVVWTQLFGMVGFELFGQLVGSADPAGPFFDYTLERMADFVGLKDDSSALLRL